MVDFKQFLIRATAVLMVAVLFAGIAPVTSVADMQNDFDFEVSAAGDLAATGQCGENVNWNYDSETGELVISGTGPMEKLYGSHSPFGGSNIKTVVINEGVTTVGSYAFYDCSQLTSVKISDGVTVIDEWAFYYCTSLKSIEIPESVTKINAWTFLGCSGLTDVYYGGTEAQWNTIAIDFNNDSLKNATLHPESALPGPHVHSGGTATCIKKAVCSCGEEYGELGDHNKVALPAKAPTCAEEGLTAGEKCSYCDEIFTEQETVAKLDHKLQVLPAVSATCTKTGLTAGKKCTVCGTVTQKQQTVSKKAHNSNVTIPAVASTYTVAGLTEGKKCSVCNTITIKQTATDKLNIKSSVVEDLVAAKVKVAKSSEITLSWTSLGDGIEYEVYQKNGKKWKKLKATDMTSYTVKKLKANKKYQFKVRAVLDGANGGYSSILTVKTVPATTTLRLKAGKKQLTASWSKVSDISGYEVQYSTSKKMKSAKTVNVKKSAKKTTVKKLSKGKKYYVRIRTYKTVNGKKVYSSWSKVQNVKVK